MAEARGRWSIVRVRGRRLDRERRDRVQLQLLPFPFFLLACLALALPSPAFLLLGVFFAGFMTVLARLVVSAGSLVSEVGRDVSATLEEGALVLPGTELARLDLDDVSLAWPSGPREIGVWTYAGRFLSFTLATPEEATSLLAELRGRQTRRAYRLPLDSPGHRLIESSLIAGGATMAMLATLAIGTVTSLIPAAAVVGFLIAVCGARVAGGARDVALGADGVSFMRGRARCFVPYREIESVRVAPGDGLSIPVVLRMRNGSVQLLPGWRSKEHAEMLTALLREGLRMNDAGASFGAELADLVRGDESTQQWRGRVASLLRGRYRDATLSPERLATLMRNPAADPDQRAAAAVALLEQPGAAPRIRVAAEVSVDPEIRETLEELADADELDDERVETLIARARRPPGSRA